MLCQICNKEFQSKRSDAKTCSETCKKALQRKLKGTNDDLKGTEKLKGTFDKSKISRTGLNYDFDEISPSGLTKMRCEACGEPVWFSPCEDCTPKVREARLLRKSKDKWGGVCTLEEWKANESRCEELALQKAFGNLYDMFRAVELSEGGIVPPKWKKHWKTKGEALTSLEEIFKSKKMRKDGRGIFRTDEVGTDYKNWK